MNGEFLYEAMGGINPVYVDEAEHGWIPKSPWRTIGPAAACLAVIAGMYLGLQALMVGTGPSELSPDRSFVGLAVTPAAQRIAEHFRSSPWLNWGSLLLALTAWCLPMVSLLRRDSEKNRTLASLIACTLSLLLQVCAVLHRVNSGDFSGLFRTMELVMPAAALLVVGTVLLNLTVRVKQRFQKK